MSAVGLAPPRTHTPGPWDAHPHQLPYIRVGLGAWGPLVQGDCIEQLVVDAVLMASAPELLAAVRAQAALLEEMAELLTRAGVPVPPMGARLQAAGAVLRATGRLL